MKNIETKFKDSRMKSKGIEQINKIIRTKLNECKFIDDSGKNKRIKREDNSIKASPISLSYNRR